MNTYNVLIILSKNLKNDINFLFFILRFNVYAVLYKNSYLLKTVVMFLFHNFFRLTYSL